MEEIKKYRSKTGRSKPLAFEKFAKKDDQKLERHKDAKAEKTRTRTSKSVEGEKASAPSRFPAGKPGRFDKKDRKKVLPGMPPAGPIRLNKFIANSGVCSRREADIYIESGCVTVNGVVVTELGSKVAATDDVRFNGTRLAGEKKVYILLNKPKNYITTVEDPHAKQTVMDLVAGACSERIYPVGRLDRNTTGVLLLTNDGELTRKLTHPSFNKKKIYHVFLNKNLKQPDMEQLVKGVELEDGLAQADAVNFVDESDRKQVGIEIHSGKNRVIRRMFEALDYNVEKLDRVYFAGLTKKSLERGKWRHLNPKEIAMLKMGAFD